MQLEWKDGTYRVSGDGVVEWRDADGVFQIHLLTLNNCAPDFRQAVEDIWNGERIVADSPRIENGWEILHEWEDERGWWRYASKNGDRIIFSRTSDDFGDNYWSVCNCVDPGTGGDILIDALLKSKGSN